MRSKTKPFKGKKANMGMTIFLGIIILNIIMYAVVYTANADTTVSQIGSGSAVAGKINATTNEDINTGSVTHWYSGFNVSVFDMPWWINIFYVTLQAIFLSLAVYALIRGLS